MKKTAILILCILCAVSFLSSCVDLSKIGKNTDAKSSPENTAPKVIKEDVNYRVDIREGRYYLTIIDGEGKETPYMYFDSEPEIEKTNSGILVVNDGTKIILFDPVTGAISNDISTEMFFAYNDDFYIAIDIFGTSQDVQLFPMNNLTHGTSVIASEKFDASKEIKAKFAEDGKSFTVTYVSKETGETVTETFLTADLSAK
ncbi:MAG: hypothetical protein IJV00_05955 [Clostridia bacterium]|nr:hypothetical protein [Clostridia bacterium]